MVFRNRMSSLRPINSRKHVVDFQGGLIADTAQFVSLANAVDSPVLAQEEQVRTGARINSIFLNVQVYATATTTLANCYMYIYKNPGNTIASSSFPDGNKVGTSDLKKLIFHQEMVMLEKNTTGIPRTLFKGVLKLPKHMRRFGYDDDLIISLYSPGITVDFCVQCIYKDYT